VGPNPSGRFVLGVETVTPTPEGLAALPALGSVVRAALDDQAADDAAAAREQEGAVAAESGAAGGPAAEAAAKLAAAACQPCFRVMESHGDQVLALPPGAVRLAGSGTAANELWAVGDDVLAFQFHSGCPGSGGGMAAGYPPGLVAAAAGWPRARRLRG
jgi:hypothetical protein